MNGRAVMRVSVAGRRMGWCEGKKGWGVRLKAVAGVFVFSSVWLSSSAWSGGVPLVPETRLRLSIIQWMPPKGIYERWDALGGDFVVSPAGALMLPVIGAVPVKDLDASGLASVIASKIQMKLMLVEKPEVTLEVLDYPPIYVVGDVAKPGEYKFRQGMTVLQALALGGGELRETGEKSQGEIELVGDLRSIETEIVRSQARIARLEAEMSGSSEIHFPPASPNDMVAKDAFAQERIIFAARANELKRQTASLGELRGLLNAEIGVLQEKIKAADASIKSAEGELTGVKSLVEKGIAVASRRSDLERALAGYKTDRLDQVTATMRARQAITEATRSADGLLDRNRTEVATSLQTEQANLDKLKMKREVSQKLLLEVLSSGSQSSASPMVKSITFEITRIKDGTPAQIAASTLTSVMPGDVISVGFTSLMEKSDQTAVRSDAGRLEGASQ